VPVILVPQKYLITHRPTKQQVLILLNSPTIEIIVANITLAVDFHNKSLVETCFKLRVKSICKIWDSMSMFTNFVTLTVELEVIKQ